MTEPRIDEPCAAGDASDNTRRAGHERCAPWPFVDLCSDGIVVVEPGSWRVLYVNRQMRRWLGAARGEAALTLADILLQPGSDELRQVLADMADGRCKVSRLEGVVAGSAGSRAVHICTGLGDFGDQRSIVLVLSAVEPDAGTPRLDERADPLTGLSDREFLIARLNALLAHDHRSERFQFAVLFVDLDNFKEVNDARGHLVGDRVLREIAHRLAACMRATDTIVRYGGDEFVVLVESAHGALECEPVIDRIHHALRQPIPLDDDQVVVSASIGVAVSGDQFSTAEELLYAADRAMYAAKQN